MSSSRTLSASSSAIPTRLNQPALVPISLSGTESMNALFDYTIVLMTPESLIHLSEDIANVNLDDFIGRELTIMIALDGSGGFVDSAFADNLLGNIGAGTREISGLITAASMLRQEGRHALYEVTLRPWLHLATLTTDCKIFQDQSVIEIIDLLFADYAFPVDKRLIETYPKRDYQTQYNESDFTFFSRLCEEWGINYFFEHDNGVHRLVLIDSIGAHKNSPSSAYHVVQFHTEGKHIDEECIHAFSPVHQLTSGQYTTRDYDYTRPKANLTASRYDPRPTAHNQQAVYQWHADAHYSQPKAGSGSASTNRESQNDPFAEGDFIARLRMQALHSVGQRAQGQGHLRGMVPGCIFTLTRHPQTAANAEYVILSTTLRIDEAAQETQASDNAHRQRYRVHVDFTVQPASENVRPQRSTPKPLTHGPATAIVVGPQGQNIWTDTLGRIKLQFPWDRLGQHNHQSSCWVRVVAPWAGNQLGGMHIPRIGQEVIVDFLSGDPDLPLCTGRVYNQLNTPPWALPSQSALSGFRSRELTPDGGNAASGRSNHLVMDDTAGKIQSQLKSDHQHSQLSLGHITRIEDHACRKESRGQGFELRTDGHGAIRAKNGLLISTESRPNASRHITDLGETAQRLIDAHGQQKSLGELAQQHGALEADEHKVVTTSLTDQNDAIQGTGGEAKDGSFPELNAPHLILASPAGIATTTPQSTHIASGEHVAITSGQDMSLSVGQRLIANVRNGIRLFAYNAGMKMIASSADIDVKALKSSLNILAKLNITHTANTISINATEEVMINGGGSYTKYNADSIESGTKGEHLIRTASSDVAGPKGLPVVTPSFLQSDFKRELDVAYHDNDAVQDGSFSINFDSGKNYQGQLDHSGKANLPDAPDGVGQLILGEDQRAFIGKAIHQKSSAYEMLWTQGDMHDSIKKRGDAP
ncbi:type VI secretion system tip protein TssI/VgrG [Glaciimonas sp. CA11.2]|uniref:type VI secretion system Vgr family protein n=2 Tax=Glaciimonas TaxID=1229970 RepID=UPI002AB5D01B|nr:type VI secretion system tip protein TssI/VgrG [Glaciimonas sp. CA11.2]MDY7547206.1 type VI secretion system tip protein TssI/VgrG [Glaciimonas sp. CA11.2]